MQFMAESKHLERQFLVSKPKSTTYLSCLCLFFPRFVNRDNNSTYLLRSLGEISHKHKAPKTGTVHRISTIHVIC